MTFRFVSNIDGTDLVEATRDLDPAETLFIVSSKTFTTLETMTNARTARDWSVRGLGGDPKPWPSISWPYRRMPRRFAKFGIDTANMFGFWDWVGGRYSMDSAIGLSTMLAIGPDHFRAMLDGFHQMDEHFPHHAVREQPAGADGSAGRLVQRLLRCADRRRPALRAVPEAIPGLSAAVDDGEQRQTRHARWRPRSAYQTSPIYWGEPGTNGQHRFYQFIHQGTKLDPVRLHRVRPDRSTLSASTTTCCWRTSSRRPKRWPSARHPAGQGRGHAGLAGAAPSVRGQPPAEHNPCRTTHAGDARQSLSPCTSTASSPRAPSGTSTRSISGASSWARCWPSASSPAIESRSPRSSTTARRKRDPSIPAAEASEVVRGRTYATRHGGSGRMGANMVRRRSGAGHRAWSSTGRPKRWKIW